MKKALGHPILGAFGGFFLLLFLALDLVLFGVIPFNSPLVTILPVAGIVAGVLWGYWAPLGSRTAPDGWVTQEEADRIVRDRAVTASTPASTSAPTTGEDATATE